MKINSKSPYYINVNDTNLTSAILDVYIYEGTQTTSRPVEATYTITNDAINENTNFEISELVNDYLDITFDGTYTGQNVFVDYQVTKYINDVAQTPETIVQLIAFNGYGYFTEGVNPQLADDILLSNSVIYTLADTSVTVPIDSTYTTNVAYYNGAIVEQTTAISTSTLSDEQIRYISYSNASDITKVVITNTDTSTTEIPITTIEECKYTPYKITFVNKYGALQDLYFFKRSNKTVTTEKTEYKGSIISNGSYNTYEHQNRILTKMGREKLQLNSGFYPETYNEVFAQLLLSDKVWILYESQTLPITITSESIDYKTHLNDKLINYTIDVEFAFDKINNVR